MADVAEVLLRMKFDGGDVNAGLSNVMGQLDRFIPGLGQISSLATDSSGALAAMGAGAAAGLGAATAAVAVFTTAMGFAVDSMRAFAETQASQAKLEGVLAATGHAAGLTATQLDEMATSLSRISGVDDEVVKNSEAVLLTFRNIRGEAFEKTMRAAQDLSAVMGGDLQGSVLQLGKALQDAAEGETRGLTALRRAGISFSDAQVEMIKKLGQSGDAAKAMGIVLGEVDRQVGGTAERMGNTYPKQIEKLTNEWNNLKETLGGKLFEGLEAAGGGNALGDITRSIQGVTDALKNLDSSGGLGALAKFAGYVTLITPSLNSWKDFADTLRQIDNATKGYTEAIKAAMNQTGFLVDEEARNADAARKYADALATKTAAEKKAAEQAAAHKKTLEELQKSLKSVLDQVDPLAKKWREYGEAVATLEKAHRAGLIFEKERTDALTKLREEASRVKVEFAQVSTVLDFSKVDITATKEFAAHWTEILNKMAEAATYFYAVASGKGQEPVDTSWGQAFQGAFDQAGQDLGRALEYGMADTFRTLAQNGDVKDALEMFSSDVSAIFGGAISTGLMDALFGYTDENGKRVSGAQAIGENNAKLSTAQRVGLGVASMAGQYLYGQGVQHQNQGQAALGGFVSGGAMGLSSGMGWYSIIPAVVMAVSAYYAAASKGTDYHFSGAFGMPTWSNIPGQTAAGTWAGITSDVTGYGNLEEQEMSKRLVQRYRELSVDFREILFLLEEPLGDWKQISIDMHGSAGDFNAIMKHLLDSKIPGDLVEAYRTTLTTGLEALGVTKARADELLDAFKNMDPTEAMAQLKNFVLAMVEGANMLEKLNVGTAALTALATAGAWEKYATGYSTAQGQINKQMVGFGSLSPEEMLSRFNTVSGIISEQYTAALAILKQIATLRTNITTGYADFKGQLAYTAAQRGGTQALAAYTTTQFQNATNRALTGAGTMSLEEIQQSWADVQKWGLALSQVADGMADLLPQFDTLKTSLADLDKVMGKSLEERWADLAKDSQTAFMDSTSASLAEIKTLRDTLGDIGGPEMLTNVTRMRDLASEAFALANSNLKAIYAASQSIASTYSNLWASWEEAEAKKQGPKALGTYYVEQLMALQGRARNATSPEELAAINAEIAKTSQALYAMGDTIRLQLSNGSIVNTIDWLRPWTAEQQRLSQKQLEGWKKTNQDVVDSFRTALGGLGPMIDAKKGELETSIAALRALIDTEMTGAVTALTKALDGLATSVGDNVTALGVVLDTLLALMGGKPSPTATTPRRHLTGHDPFEMGTNPPREYVPPTTGGGGTPPGPLNPETGGLLGAVAGLGTGTEALSSVVDDLSEAIVALQAAVDQFTGAQGGQGGAMGHLGAVANATSGAMAGTAGNVAALAGVAAQAAAALNSFIGSLASARNAVVGWN